MLVENPVFSMYGDIGGVKRGRDGSYVFDGAAGSAGISFQFPEGWNKFDTVTFAVEAENLRPEDGAMSFIVNDGYNVWNPPVAKNPYPWIQQGANALTYPTALFSGCAASFQLNETFGHSTNWKITVTAIEFHHVERRHLIAGLPDFTVLGDTSNRARNPDGSYTFAGDASALLCFRFPDGWNGFENVSFFIDDVENHVADSTMSLIVKSRCGSWTDVDKHHGNRYPGIEPGDNVLTYKTFLFDSGASLQLNQYGHSANWTMRFSKMVFHDGSLNDLFLD